MNESLIKERYFDPDARYRSADGKMMARMIDVTETHFVMERWYSGKTAGKIKFELPIWFLLHSPRCGWKRIGQYSNQQ